MNLNDIRDWVADLLKDKGFDDAIKAKDVYKISSLIHTEVSEYVQEYKHHGLAEEHKAARAEEIADVIIRALNLAVMEDIDIHKAVCDKMRKNYNRPYKYGTVEEGTIVE